MELCPAKDRELNGQRIVDLASMLTVCTIPSQLVSIATLDDFPFHNILSLLENFCHSKFPYLPNVPNVSDVLKYGGWNMNPSNTMFTNGELDPWRAMTIHADSGLNAEAPNRMNTRTIPECNEPPPATEVFGILHPGVVHVPDFRRRWEDESGPVDESLELFRKALDLWLPCFQKSSLT